MEPSKKDWKLFRDKIAGWQEIYMEKLVEAYIELLNEDQKASSKFWELEKRIKLDKKKPGVLISLDKGEMLFDIVQLINDGAITREDLSEFSDDFRDAVGLMLDRGF